MLIVLIKNMTNKVEKQIVKDYLINLRKTYESEGTTIADRYTYLKKFKLPSNSTVVCLNCMDIHHKKKKVKCCDKSPNYNMTTSYRIILSHIEKENDEI